MRSVISILVWSGLAAVAVGQDKPHNQDRPPGPALSPVEAIAKMQVPPGFKVEVVAAEPNIVNPVAMTFDERGRVWITESLEYPRSAPGVGKDRIKVLEDTDGDGQADKFTVFAEGLNIPSGIAVGHGGVWVANAPDLLFLQDTDGDGKADKREVVLTGFGRTDTHELPNSLTWGPDGWLYGLNGVFNFSHVKYRGREYKFTCTLFRIHPRTRDFELFCEGTSNPWGVAFNHEGSAFVSACVIDHLWHLVESGYYHRQGGPYPPFTWKINSIVKHKHQKAAYCGLHFFDSDAYPPEFREKLYMGNIHGNCINSDKLTRQGSTYFATGEPDFLSANDAWFMPVVQKTGPDGCLYILDWYDRYHCYQDARRDPEGIDRLKGRLYRVRYENSQRAPQFDLAGETDAQLVTRLGSPNVYFRDAAQRVLIERQFERTAGQAATRAALENVVFDDEANRKQRLHALFVLVGSDAPGEPDAPDTLLPRLLKHADPTLRAWGIRALGNRRVATPELRQLLIAAASDPVADVRLQVAIAARKVLGEAAVDTLLAVLAASANDPIIPNIVWQNLHPLMETQGSPLVEKLAARTEPLPTGVASLFPRLTERLLAVEGNDSSPAGRLFAMLLANRSVSDTVTRDVFSLIAGRVQSGELQGPRLAGLRKQIDASLNTVLKADQHPLTFDLALLTASWGEPAGVERVRQALVTAQLPAARRLEAVQALVAAKDPELLNLLPRWLADRQGISSDLRGQLLAAVGRLDAPEVADIVLAAYAKLEPEVQPVAIEVLTQRASWSARLLAAVAKKEIAASAIHVNQVRKLLSAKDPALRKLVLDTWGSVRETRNPQREAVIGQMRTLLRSTPGDAHKGQAVFAKVCGQCHKIYGEGQEVGPDITRNGRSSFEQLLSNVFDPSLVIGADYRARTVLTTKGRSLSGLLVEDSPQRVVLKVQGGKTEIIPRAEVDELTVSEVSLMPEGLEKQLKPDELADLFAYITLDRPPSDPQAKQLPGVREPTPRSSNDAKEFPAIVGDVAYGFATSASGEGGVAILAEYQGRRGVLRVHPPKMGTPCVLTRQITVVPSQRTRLYVDAGHDPRGDWQLRVKVGAETLHDSVVGKSTSIAGWSSINVDLSKFAGKTITVEVHNHPNNWAFEHAYFSRVEVVTD